MSVERAPDDFKYWAFVSYSHADERWAKWLHRGLETYRVPRGLVGRPSLNGPIPRRVFPVFRDRDELASSASLGDEIQQALERTRYLIVVCSPKAAVSRWVNEEVILFKRLGREDRILCLIVDGEPFASDRPRSGQLECFAPALRYRLGDEGRPGQEHAEPLAADVRPGGDGTGDAKLKLLAGLLGVAFDDLKQRERRRRIWWRVQIAAAAVAVAVAIGGVWYQGAQETRRAAQGRHLRLAQLMLQKAKDAVNLRQEGAAALYAAQSIKYSLLAEQAPLEIDFLASLSPFARLQATLGDEQFAGGAAFSPDGGVLAWGARDGTVRLHDLRASERIGTSRGATAEPGRPERPGGLGGPSEAPHVLSAGRAIARLAGHDAPVSAVAWSTGGARIASGSADGAVRLWDAAARKPLTVSGRHRDRVTSVVFDAAGRLLATGSWDTSVRLWDVERGSGLAELRHAAPVHAVALSPDARLLAAATRDNAFHVWDVASRTRRAVVKYSEPVTSVAFSPDGRLLAAAVRDGSTKLWDVADEKEVAALGRDRLAPLGVAFNDDGSLLAVAGRDRTVKLWEISSREEVARLTGHEDEVELVAFGPHGRTLVSGSADGTLKLWSVQARSDFRTLTGHDGPVRAVGFGPDDTWVVSAADDRTIRFWDVATGRATGTLTAHDDSVRALAVSPDGRTLATGSRDRTVKLWDVARREPVASTRAHDHYVVALAFSPDGTVLASGGWDHRIKLWAVPGLRPLGVLDGHDKEVGGIAFSPDGRLLASAGYDSTVRLWDVERRAAVATLEGHRRHARAVAFTPDGRQLVSGGWDRLIRLWDIGTRTVAASWTAHHSYEVWALAISPDGRLLASATPSPDRHTIRLFDVAQRSLVDQLSGHSQYALAVEFNRRGDLLASGGTDRTVRLWRVADFWPPRSADAPQHPGQVLRRFLDRPPYDAEHAERLINDVERMTGLVLEGTEATSGRARGSAR